MKCFVVVCRDWTEDMDRSEYYFEDVSVKRVFTNRADAVRFIEQDAAHWRMELHFEWMPDPNRPKSEYFAYVDDCPKPGKSYGVRYSILERPLDEGVVNNA